MDTVETKIHFGQALRDFRHARGLSQEDFTDVSGRTYLSALERGLKSPTIDKVGALARTLGIHPISLLAHCYLMSDPDISQDQLIEQLQSELSVVRKGDQV
jgi:transcriptional regulator with XRE-family HTH domain